MAPGGLLQVALSQLSFLSQVAAGAVAGLAAAIAMVVPMSRQPEGFTPAYIAASVLRRTTPDEVRFVEANVVHHGTGMVAGGLYAAVLMFLSGVVPDLVRMEQVELFPHLLSVSLVVLFVYVFFAHLVLPRAGGRIYEEQATAVRGQWLRSSLVFGAVLVVVGPTLLSSTM
ncbi:hypothetical protein SAMN04487948_101403 [Halogranum amylolyticum]|uniref:Uncharacterized protein n=1 Tax=Halogranum amylolyticum TaxID=660520 RepID=A0A1H8N9N0_9EURY|nr:hypothetical protein [Halogranum amylolyticum]SEO26262.1 hypothetical protein SAMN04487948_101403 [Halogranum amylolyticum]